MQFDEIGRRQRVSTKTLLNAVATVPKLDADRLRADLDAFADQDPMPRA